MSEMFRMGRQALEGYRVFQVGLDPARADLYHQINQRTRWMFENGLVEEVQRNLAQGIPKTASPFQSHGYREAIEFLEGSISLEQAIRTAQAKTRQYAKRQLTWFRKEPAVEWFAGFGTDPAIQQKVIHFLAGCFT